MDYDPINFKLQKAVQDTMGHTFYIDWDAGAGRCSECNEGVTVPVFRPQFYRATDLVSLNAGGVKNYLLISPNTLTRAYLTYLVLGDNTVTYQLFQGATVSANGTPLSLFNNDGNSTTPPEMAIYSDPTVTSNGTGIDLLRIPSDRGRAVPPVALPSNEFILQQNTIYLLTLTALNNNTNITSRINWAEVK